MLFIQHWLWEELNSLIKSQGAERPDLPYAISLREGMLVYTVAFYMSQMIQNHHFPLSFCWRGSTVGGGSYKKQKLCKDHLVWAKKKKKKMLASNELLSASARHNVNMIMFSINGKTTAHSPVGGEDADSVALAYQRGTEDWAQASESGGSRIQLHVSHFLVGEFGHVIEPLWALVSSWAKWREFAHFIGCLGWIKANSKQSKHAIDVSSLL